MSQLSDHFPQCLEKNFINSKNLLRLLVVLKFAENFKARQFNCQYSIINMHNFSFH